MVNYIDANSAPLRNTGDIRLYDEEAFEGMRRPDNWQHGLWMASPNWSSRAFRHR